MSQATKDYILKLDIEKDARILKERLNVCTEALDYFCASSSILKAGVNAGLSLYDIAIMCCRNDNLGEIPSKLEILISMAADLAESAIENGRWHHAAASKALVEQLSPKGGSLLTYAATGSKSLKALSAVDLVQYAEDMVSMDAYVASKKDACVPGGVMSSASDSSSDNGDGDVEEQEECQEWATNVIADISLDKSNAAVGKKGRSSSIGSAGSDDSSDGVGFWYINPNSSPDLLVESDEESISWSPANSPPNRSFMELSAAGLRSSLNSLSGMSRRASVVLLHDENHGSAATLFRSSSKVTFANDPLMAKVREDVDLPDHPQFKHSKSDVGHLEPPALLRTASMMRRSQSYSALTSTSTLVENHVEEDARLHRTVNPEKYREYFLKFIDLVIVRETTSASQLKTAL